MKKLIIGMTLSLASVSAFANLNDCADLMGKYSCIFDGSKVALSLEQTLNSDLKIEIDGLKENLTVDGKSHKSGKGDSSYVAECTESKKLQIVYSFKETRQTILFSKSNEVITFAAYKNDEAPITLSCLPHREIN